MTRYCRSDKSLARRLGKGLLSYDALAKALRNAAAASLREGQFQPKRVPSAKRYRRKPKHSKEED